MCCIYIMNWYMFYFSGESWLIQIQIYIYRLIGKDPDARRDGGAGGEGDDGGWDGWMASLTRWTWVWVDSGSWKWTGKPGMLQFMGSQRVGHDWVTELNWYVYTHTYTHIYTYIMEVCLSSVIHLSTYLPMCLSYILEAFRQVSIVNLISNFGQSFIPIYV